MVKIPIMVEIIGEPGTGKTHLSLTFPNPLLIDTTPKMESLVVAKKLYPEDWQKRYRHVNTMQQLRAAVEYGIREGFKTVIFDTSPDLQRLAVNEWLQETGKEKPYPIVVFGQIRDKVDKVIYRVVSAERNVVFTSQLKDEYVGGEKTGRRERDGYKRLDFMCDIRLYLKIVEVKEGSKKKYKRVAKVIKNRFLDVLSPDYVWEIVNPSFEDIKKLVLLGGLSEDDLVL